MSFYTKFPWNDDDVAATVCVGSEVAALEKHNNIIERKTWSPHTTTEIYTTATAVALALLPPTSHHILPKIHIREQTRTGQDESG